MTQVLFAVILTLVFACECATAGTPVEVGSVRWSRDLDAALARSADAGKPVFLLFQEVPGCAGCQAFGRDVLSHPLLVEAIEDEFLPVLVHNNTTGDADEAILKRFGEPAWNFQVVRFLDPNGKDLLPRKDRVWSVGALASRMTAALRAAKRPVPAYLAAVAAEAETTHHAETAFSMYCFWTGEMELGAIDGVVRTEAGWLEGREVTRVVYDTSKLSLEAMTRKAQAVKCAGKVYAPAPTGGDVAGVPAGTLDETYRPAATSDQKKQIEGWAALRKVPGITAMQLTKINAFAPRDRAKALGWLSPRQRQALAALEAAARDEAAAGRGDGA